MQPLDIIFDGINKLSLVFLDSTTNFWSNEQRVEFAEHSEHLVGVSSSGESITKTRNDLVFHP